MQVKVKNIVLLGSYCVGKTSLMKQFIEEKFDELYVPTVEKRLSKTIKIGNQAYKLNILDTTGLYEYSLIPVEYGYTMDGYCMVYSINNRVSFKVVQLTYAKLMSLTGNIRVPIVLVANKIDLEKHRQVDTKAGKEFADYMGAEFFEVTAKNNLSVSFVFASLVSSIDSCSLYDRQCVSTQQCTSRFTAEECLEQDSTIEMGNEKILESNNDKKCIIV